ncbi:MAG: ATP-grasp domain-containing protein [Aureispira sp.]|nr:ATP-grasp domain-containing protein [Aureispira sp.]
MHKMHQELVSAAKDLAIEVIELDSIGAEGILLFKKDNKEVVFREGFPLNLLNTQTEFWLDNKQLTKRTFEQLGITCPKSIVIEATQNEQAIADFWVDGVVYVSKPLYGTDGDGVEMNVKTKEHLKDYLNNWKSKYKLFLLEEQVEGEDLRIHILGGKIVAACCRKPAYVVGDGEQNIEELISQRSKVIKQQNPANKLIVDQVTKDLLRIQGLLLSTIPKKGQEIKLKHVANMSQGGIAIDITEELHPKYQEWVTLLAKELNASCFALDAITKDHTVYPEDTTWALEINPRPHWLHHTFSEVKQHPMAQMILKEVFGLN